ncbi:MAG TPA: AAA family ATPase [Oculatellaceae cyanobacterium]
MLIQEIDISGYRSVKDIRLKLATVTVLVGPNGSGKSNIYQALQLVAACAQGRFARQVVREGGIGSVLWAGPRKNFEDARIRLGVKFDDLTYELETGRVPLSDRMNDGPGKPGLSRFTDDPDIKVETVGFTDRGKTISLLERKRGSIMARSQDGQMVQYPGNIAQSESVLSELREPHKFPELSILRTELMNWRFYHEFRTDLHSPIRQPQIATYTAVMSNDGIDVGSALATIEAIGDSKTLHESIESAFPGSSLTMEVVDGALHLYMTTESLMRKMNAREFSDGTLQFLCLLGALLTPRPGTFVVLNEPETSIHVDLFPALAELIGTASSSTQILVTTHARELANLIQKRVRNQTVIELEKTNGATQLQGVRFP